MSQGQHPAYTYVASSLDGRTSFLDLKIARDRDEMTRHAHRLLADHGSCDKVEVWADSAQVALVLRVPAAGPEPGLDIGA